MSQENTQIKESYDKVVSKLAHLQDNHIIIPKDGKKSHSNESF